MPNRRKYKRVEPGDVFGRLTATASEFVERRNGYRFVKAACRCDCGATVVVAVQNLHDGSTRSCGCLSSELSAARATKHGMAGTALHDTWQRMLSRCRETQAHNRPDYAGRGIAVCPEWQASYEAFKVWAMTNGYADGLTIERKDVDGNYEPSNCVWIPRSQQALNRRTTRLVTAFGETKPLAEWFRDSRTVIKPCAFYRRLQKGMDVETALTMPNQRERKRLRMEPASQIDS